MLYLDLNLELNTRFGRGFGIFCVALATLSSIAGLTAYILLARFGDSPILHLLAAGCELGAILSFIGYFATYVVEFWDLMVEIDVYKLTQNNTLVSNEDTITREVIY